MNVKKRTGIEKGGKRGIMQRTVLKSGVDLLWSGKLDTGLESGMKSGVVARTCSLRAQKAEEFHLESETSLGYRH